MVEKVVICNRYNAAYDALPNGYHSHTRQKKHKLLDSTRTWGVQWYEARAIRRTGSTGWYWWLAAIAGMIFTVLARVIRKHFRWWKLSDF